MTENLPTALKDINHTVNTDMADNNTHTLGEAASSRSFDSSAVADAVAAEVEERVARSCCDPADHLPLST